MSLVAVAVSFTDSASAPAATPPPPTAAATGTLLGPVLTTDESPTVSMGRDDGYGVPLSGSKDFWVFGDSPRMQYRAAKRRWTVTAFIRGSTAAVGPYAQDVRPNAMDEVVVGHRLAATNRAAQFLPGPTNVFIPKSGGRRCTVANGAEENGRWATGAALMPNRTTILVSYIVVCVLSSTDYTAEGWGFAEFNWRTNKFVVPPIDVVRPEKSGAALPDSNIWGSPLVSGNHVTFFSVECCTLTGTNIYMTTVAANLGSLKNRGSYTPHAILSLRAAVTANLNVHVAVYSPSLLRLIEPTDTTGDFSVYSASSPAGPWSEEMSGTLPGCQTSPQACRTLFGHPELSTSTRLVVSYYLPGYGPGVPGHPDHRSPMNHVVLASFPVK